MKPRLHQFLLLLLAFVVLPSYAQEVLWEKSYGGLHADYLTDMQPTADYGFLIAGSSLSNKSGNKSDDNKGNLDYWIWKMDENGDLDWQKSFGGAGSDLLQSVALTRDGGFILAGVSASALEQDKKEDNQGGDDIWILKLNAQGNEEWQKTIGGTGQEKVQAIVATPDGGYIIGGSSSSEESGQKTAPNYGNLDYWVIKLDAKGKIAWQHTYGGRYADELQSIVTTKEGGYLLGGTSNSPASGNKLQDNLGQRDYWVLKLDDKGGIVWQKIVGSPADDALAVVQQTHDGGYILGGSSNGALEASSTDFWVVKLDANGGILWQETYDFGAVDLLTSIVENADDSLLIGGYSKGENSILNGTEGYKKNKKGTDDYIALKVNATGQELWNKTVGSHGEDILKKAIETRDGGYVLAGTSLPSNLSKGGALNGGFGSNDFWVVKLKDSQKKEEERAIIEAFPNPTTAFTNVIVGYEFDTGTATVADLSGRQLQQFEISSRTVPVDLSALPEGIYVINIKTNNQNHGIKVIKKNSKN